MTYLFESLNSLLGFLVTAVQVSEGGLHRADVLQRLVTLADHVSQRLFRRRRHVVLLSCKTQATTRDACDVRR